MSTVFDLYDDLLILVRLLMTSYHRYIGYLNFIKYHINHVLLLIQVTVLGPSLFVVWILVPFLV